MSNRITLTESINAVDFSLACPPSSFASNHPHDTTRSWDEAGGPADSKYGVIFWSLATPTEFIRKSRSCWVARRAESIQPPPPMPVEAKR